MCSARCSFYNLDAIISVCYRVNSRQATQFRIGQDQVFESDFDRETKKLLKGGEMKVTRKPKQ